MGELLDAKEVARCLGVTRKTIYNYISTGAIPFIELSSKNYRFRKEDVEEFLQKKKVLRRDER